jgi:predicted RNA-binding protein
MFGLKGGVLGNYWLAVGPSGNWETAFDQGNIWGLTAKQKHLWERLVEGDILLFYATKPVCGVIGYGKIRTRFRQDQPFWPQELREKRLIWPLRFEFDVEHCLAPAEWNLRKVTSDTLKLKAGIGFHSLDPEFARLMLSQLQPEEATALSSHEGVKRKLVEIGKLQNYLAEAEYSFDIGKLDVVWRRVLQSVPTYVFEVHVSGDIYHALAKLKHAFDLWNSHIFVVAQQSDREKVRALLAGTFHEIDNRLKFIELAKVEELHKRKKAYLDLEKELGI